jgi:CheY-like chemotaxis protein
MLVAANHRRVRNLVSWTLVSAGYRVVQAHDGDEAVRVASRHEPKIDLLLSNAILPGMYGWHLAELLKLDYPKLKTLYMATYLGNHLLAPIGRVALGLLRKPSTQVVLLDCIREVLDEQHPDSRNSALSVQGDFFVFRALRPLFNANAPGENSTEGNKSNNISVIGETVEIDVVQQHTRAVWNKYAFSVT